MVWIEDKPDGTVTVWLSDEERGDQCGAEHNPADSRCDYGPWTPPKLTLIQGGRK